METINVTSSSMPGYDEYVMEIKELWESKWLTNNGTKHEELKTELRKYYDSENISLCTNGHLALENILHALGLEGEVITTPYTFISTTSAIVRMGLIPVFCDIKEDDYTIDPNKIEKLITEKTSAILATHVYGNICDVEEIEKIAKKYNLKVIYDAAHCFGIRKNNKSITEFGDAVMFSFHATKVFNTIEGGAVFSSKDIIGKIDALNSFGMVGEDEAIYVAGNSKMNEFQAAMGICNMRHVDEEIYKRSIVYERYLKRLSNVEGVKLNYTAENVKTNFSYFPVLFNSKRNDRNEISNILKKEKIFARKYFYPITSEFDCFKSEFNLNNTPIAKHISENILTLPLYSDLSIENVDRICDIIIKNI